MLVYNDVIKFDCIYQQNGEVKDNYNWTGYIKRITAPIYINNSAVSSLYGYTIDKQVTKTLVTQVVDCKQIEKPFVDKRYLCGEYGMIHADGIIRFVIFSKFNRPIDYEFRYDEEDCCLYGVWYFTDKSRTNTEFGGYAKLTMDQEVEYTEYEIDRELLNGEAFSKNVKTINELYDLKLANLIDHTSDGDERFAKAKEYFNGRSRVREH